MKYRVGKGYGVKPNGFPATTYRAQYRLWGSWLDHEDYQAHYERDKAEADVRWLEGMERKKRHKARARRKAMMKGWVRRGRG